jgi:preprotein translocase subunit SecG
MTLMSALYYLAIVLHVVACLFLIGVVLLQEGKNQDLASAFGGGGSQTAFGPRGQANVLSRATTILAGVFMVTSLSLSLLRPHETSVLDRLPAASAPAAVPAAATTPASTPAASTPAEAAPAPAASSAPAAPASPAGK